MSALGLALWVQAAGLGSDGPDDRIWLVSTRGAPSCRPDASAIEKIRVWKRGGGDRWVRSHLAALSSPHDPGTPTTFFLHGNRSDRGDAIREGWSVYRCLARTDPRPPIRLVIWSWPADRVSRRPRRDLQIKAARSDIQGYYLAECLGRMKGHGQVSLVGYSYGARAITAALELLAGGRIAGLRLAGDPGARPAEIRAVLIAAALDNDWLLPGRRNGLALSQVDGVLVTRNGCDPALKWYPMLYRRGGSEALGFTGPACPSRLGPEARKVDVLDVSCSVGKNHRWAAYIASMALRSRLAQYSLFGPESIPDDGADAPAASAKAD